MSPICLDPLSGESAVWRKGDANCCPSGGRIRFTLKLAGPALAFTIDEARYTPPAAEAR